MTDLKNEALKCLEREFLFDNDESAKALKKLQILSAAEIISDMAKDAVCGKFEDGSIKLTLAGVLELKFDGESFYDISPSEFDSCSFEPLASIKGTTE